MANLDDFGYVDMENTAESGGDPLPDGTYHVAILGVSVPESQRGTPYLKIEFGVVEGQYARRRVWDNFSLWSTTTDVPRQRYKSLRRALGLNPNVAGDTDELLQLECLIGVKVRDRSADGYPNDNKITSYKSLNAPVATPKPSAAPKAAAPVSRASGSAPRRSAAPSATAGSENAGYTYPWTKPEESNGA